MLSASNSPFHESCSPQAGEHHARHRRGMAGHPGLPARTRVLKPGQDIVRDGDRPSQCCFLLAGWACRYKMLSEGRRQILSFHIPGDMPDLQSLHLHTLDHSIGTLTEATVAFVPHESLRDLTALFPRPCGDPLARDPDRRCDLPRVDDRHRPALGVRADGAPVLRDARETCGRWVWPMTSAVPCRSRRPISVTRSAYRTCTSIGCCRRCAAGA